MNTYFPFFSLILIVSLSSINDELKGQCTTPANIGQGKPITQSTTFFDGISSSDYIASKANDGDNVTFNHTSNELQPWIEIDLGAIHNITSLEVVHRTQCAPCSGRLKKFKIFISNVPVTSYSNTFVYQYDDPNGLGNGQSLPIPNLNTQGRYVRIWADFPAPLTESYFIHLAEFKVFGCAVSTTGCGTGSNVSSGKTASQSSNAPTNAWPASYALDNNTSTFQHTDNEIRPWWQIDLGSDHRITSIEITHRLNCSACAGRAKKFKVFLYQNAPYGTVNYDDAGHIFQYDNPTGLGNGEIYNITGLNHTGRYLRIWLDHVNTALPMHFAEVKVFGCGTGSVTPSCTDGIQNGTETGIDCGGTCPACPTVTGTQWLGSSTASSGIYRTGIVHIGKSNVTTGSEAGYNLYVTGGIKSEKIKVEISSPNGWADYIFYKGYNLLPIREVERFIRVHHHLPDFPSESTILRSGGYEVSDMIKRQQVGIESLYLYTIELEKKVEGLKVLEKRVEELDQLIHKNFKD